MGYDFSERCGILRSKADARVTSGIGGKADGGIERPHSVATGIR